MWKKRIRKWHRYLGFLLGIQFLFWTLGGLYFSWTNIEQVKGEHLLKGPVSIPLENEYISLDVVLGNFKKQFSGCLIEDIHLIPLPDGWYYQLVYTQNAEKKALLCHTQTGHFKEKITRREAVWVASQRLRHPAEILEVRQITHPKDDIAYRNKPLPAYAIQYAAPSATTVFVSAQLGTVQTLRSTQWRVYDFFWMLHIMDFEGRSNFNNLLLRVCSILGLLTTLSGFALYIFTNRFYRRWQKKQTLA